MKQVFKLLSILLFAALVVSSCREDEDRFVPYDETEITTTISGLVADESGAAVADAKVLFQGTTITTDQNGVFTFYNVKVKSQAYIQVNKAGYFLGSRTIFPKKGARQFMRIHLLEKQFANTFSASAGATVSVEGVSIEFPANAIVDGANPYDGEVKVAVKLLDPSLAATGAEMPGALVGMSTSGERQSMASYSMVAVELQGSAGQKLNLGNGKKAKITFPIPASLQSSAPGLIPLWSFNEVSGYWEEEGSAIKTGNTYVGEVSHFSFWNCDAPFPLIHLSGTILDPNGNPMQVSVRIKIASNGMVGNGWTNEEGVFEGKVPKDELLTLEVLDICGNITYSQSIGPFSADVALPPITVSQSSTLVHVIGTVVDCDNLPIDSAYVILSIGTNTQVVFTDNNGAFESAQYNCGASSDVVIKAVDGPNLLESDEIVLPAAPEVNAGAIVVCSNPLSEYIRFNIDGGDTHVLITPSVFDTSTTDLVFTITAGGQSGEPPKAYEFYMHGSGPRATGVPGTIDFVSIFIGENGGNGTTYIKEVGTGSITWTQIANVAGEYYEGTFTVPDVIGGAGLHLLTGDFRVKRK